ncbi:protein NRT1/ PTR FAMILY 5.10 isoform X1 [Dendrobium catenatum]|uniref:Putative peptide/nitrate transporter n=1 Tax=Dendrobium catenatum TaxID=906689 RepID=A0A2I0VYP0_9ASPA|nr:protein NRT1/ PTR FAMILY 5.10 isoform X1 [Dendrobium catenatum]PKU68526.1 putative peptide/nitrate transporter [Dendrobium catenatum]
MENYPLLGKPVAMDGVLDYRGRTITKQDSGRWVAASFILVMEMAERVAFNGIMFNLITYMTGPLGESNASAAAAVTVWSGASMMLPILGALVSDSFLSRYRTIIVSAILYVLGLGLLSLSAVLPNRSNCYSEGEETMSYAACPPTTLRVTLFYFSLYLVAFAQGGHRPCSQAFGADQFDETDSEESMWRSSFFNWWIFGLSLPMIVSPIILSYVQENVNWGIGFGIPCVLMSASFTVFLMGSRFYRCYTLKEKSSYAQISQLLATLVRIQRFSSVKFKAKAQDEHGPESSHQPRLEASEENLNTDQIEEAKGLLRLFPIWASCVGYTLVLAQFETFFTKQGGTLYRKIGSNFQIPAAGLQGLNSAVVTFTIVIYDRIAVPLARNVTGIPSGFTMLQRIGTGLLISIFVMVISALVEIKRLETAREFGLVDEPNSVLPMSILWLFPQYILMGIATAISIGGLQEFFYDQMPDALRSLGVALCISIFGVGNLINSFLVYVTDKATMSITGESWFSNNLNRAHLDYFYWLVAGLNVCLFVLFILSARSYVYKKKKEICVI